MDLREDMGVKKMTRKTYSPRDLAEARAFAKDTTLVDGDNYAHPLDEDPDMVFEIAELIAKVRRRGERVAKELRRELRFFDCRGQ